MFMFGCEFDTVGKALWDVVRCSRRANPGFAATAGDGSGETKDADEAFWAWVKETLKSGLEEGEDDEVDDGHDLEEVEEVDEDALSDSDGLEVREAPSKLDLGGVLVTLERVGETPGETLRELTVGFVASKGIDGMD